MWHVLFLVNGGLKEKVRPSHFNQSCTLSTKNLYKASVTFQVQGLSEEFEPFPPLPTRTSVPLSVMTNRICFFKPLLRLNETLGIVHICIKGALTLKQMMSNWIQVSWTGDVSCLGWRDKNESKGQMHWDVNSSGPGTSMMHWWEGNPLYCGPICESNKNYYGPKLLEQIGVPSMLVNQITCFCV